MRKGGGRSTNTWIPTAAQNNWELEWWKLQQGVANLVAEAIVDAPLWPGLEQLEPMHTSSTVPTPPRVEPVASVPFQSSSQQSLLPCAPELLQVSPLGAELWCHSACYSEVSLVCGLECSSSSSAILCFSILTWVSCRSTMAIIWDSSFFSLFWCFFFAFS